MFQEDIVQQAIESGPEIMVYFLINEIGGFTWRMNHDMGHQGRIPEESHASISKDVAAAIEQQVRIIKEALPRFGVEQPLNENGAGSEDYWKWFRWWDGWSKGLPEDVWEAMQPDLSMEMTEEQIAKHRPPGDWREPKEEPCSEPSGTKE